jgi:23S rRNA pseudouridine1911/1915/1917 synthase
MQPAQHRLVIPAANAGQRLDQALAELLPDYSRTRIKQWIEAGRVRLDGAEPSPRTRVEEGHVVEVDALIEAAPSATRPEAMALTIVHEDDHVLVVDKPAGLVVHPGAGNAAGTLANGLLAHAPALAALPRSGLIHRLDKDTTGLLVVAKSVAAHTRLVRDLEARRIRREYRALVTGAMTAGGTVDAPLGRHPTRRTRMAVLPRGRRAVTHYRVLARFPAHTFIALRLESGRTHQIRVHMAHIRHPVVGDPEYGGRLVIPAGASPAMAEALRGFRRQALHASRLSFRHPVTGERLDFTAPLPGDFRALLALLAGGAEGAAVSQPGLGDRRPAPDADEDWDRPEADDDLDAGEFDDEGEEAWSD